MEPKTNGEIPDANSPSVNAQQASLADTSKTQKLEKKFLAHLNRMCGNRTYHRYTADKLDEKIEFAKEQYSLALAAMQSERHGSEAAAVAHLREAILRIKGESLAQIVRLTKENEKLTNQVKHLNDEVDALEEREKDRV